MNKDFISLNAFSTILIETLSFSDISLSTFENLLECELF